MKKISAFLWLLCGVWACSVSAQTVKINTQAQLLPQPETGLNEKACAQRLTIPIVFLLGQL